MRRSDRAAVRALVDGELSEREAQALRQRAAADAALGAYLRQMEATTQALRGLQQVDAPLPTFVRPVHAPAPKRSWALGLVSAAAASAAGGLAWWTLTTPPAAPVPDDGNLPVELAFNAPEAGQVQVAGDFNAWQPTALTRDGDRWATQLRLPPGRYAYMYVVDGRWTADPEAHSFRDDEFGRKNAVLHL
ncbi:MAG: glycoside hydrolase family 13 [Myxococcales bacterium]|nr:glycoside hydrolase family 13 [Myxococcales bacterium]